MTDEQVENIVASLRTTHEEPNQNFVAELRERVHQEASSSADSPVIRTDDLGEPIMTNLKPHPTAGSDTDPPKRGRTRRANIGLAAAAIVVVVALAVAGVSSLGGDDDEVIPGTSAQTFGEDTARATVDAFFDAYNDGDDLRVLALLAPEPEIVDSIVGEWTLADWSQLIAFYAAQGSVYTPAECTLFQEEPGSSVTLRCSTEVREVTTQAVDAPGVPTELSVTVTPAGISGLNFDYTGIDFNHVEIPFEIWLEQQHPDDLGSTAFGSWSSVEDARQTGIRRAAFAQEWADYLDENGCGYRDRC